MFFKYINFRIFLVSFALGILYVYLNEDHKKIIVIHPTPDNYEQYQFKDKTGTCFSYQLKELKCPNESFIQNVQIQK